MNVLPFKLNNRSIDTDIAVNYTNLVLLNTDMYVCKTEIAQCSILGKWYVDEVIKYDGTFYRIQRVGRS